MRKIEKLKEKLTLQTTEKAPGLIYHMLSVLYMKISIGIKIAEENALIAW